MLYPPVIHTDMPKQLDSVIFGVSFAQVIFLSKQMSKTLQVFIPEDCISKLGGWTEEQNIRVPDGIR